MKRETLKALHSRKRRSHWLAIGWLVTVAQVVVGLWVRPAAAQTADQINVVFSAAPDPVVPGGVVVFTARIANISATTATGNFWVRANFPEHLTATSVWDGFNGGCVNGCRYGGYANWSVASLAPGQVTILKYVANVDNSTMYPPPAAGTVLSSDLSLIHI